MKTTEEENILNTVLKELKERYERIEDELKWLESIQENLLLGKRKKGQHKFNRISVKERIEELKQRIENDFHK